MPPSGWTLAVLLALYIFAGLVGHDPWKNDDAVTIGVVHDIVVNGHWLTPGLAGRPYTGGPLYYWLGAVNAHLFGWLLPLHDAARLASGVFTLLALGFILLAARTLHGREQAPAAPLLLAGSIGFLFHAHEAQPMLAALTAHTAAYWGLAQLAQRPRRGACCFGIAFGLGCLANGLAPMLPLLPIAALAAWRSEERQRAALWLLASLVLAAAVAGWWPAVLLMTSPDFLTSFLQGELAQLSGSSQPLMSLGRLLSLLTWYAWPALPLAGWTLWVKRRQLLSPSFELPIVAFLLAVLFTSFCFGVRSAPTLLVLPPLVLLAVPGVGSLRRGAANAFDWFGMITFSFLALLVWIGWLAITFGWPEALARQAIRLEPGFVSHFGVFAVSLAVAGTLVWFWLIVTSPRSPMRGVMHWMAGLTLFWLLIAALWMPWIDYGKTYRSVSASLVAALPKSGACISAVDVSDSFLASLDYFQGVRTIPSSSPESEKCTLLLMLGTPKEETAARIGGWQKLWEGGRPGDRRGEDRLRLYHRRKPAER